MPSRFLALAAEKMEWSPAKMGKNMERPGGMTAGSMLGLRSLVDSYSWRSLQFMRAVNLGVLSITGGV